MRRRPIPERELPAAHRERFATPGLPPRARLRSDEVEAWLERTRAVDPGLRRRAVQALCPCHVQADVAAVWERVIALADDPDAGVRRAVFHALTDGSPRAREARVLTAIEGLRMDPDPKLRRQVRRFLAQHRRTGRVNVN